MSDPLKNLMPGDPIPMSVRTWNPLLELARNASKGSLPSAIPEGLDIGSQTVIHVINKSNVKFERFACIGLNGFEVGSAASLATFQGRTVARGVRASALRVPAITIDPIPVGKIGRAVVAGVVPVQIDSTTASPTHAEAFWESPIMVGAGTGYPILQRESGTGTRWGWIRLGSPPTRGVAFGVHRMAQNSGWYAQLTLPPSIGTSLATWRSLDMRGNCAHLLANDNDRLRFINRELRYWRVRASCWVALTGSSTAASFQILTNCFAEHRVLLPPAAPGFQAKTQVGTSWQHLHDELWIGTVGNNWITSWFNGVHSDNVTRFLSIGHFELTLDEVTQFEFQQVIAKTNLSGQTSLPMGPTPPTINGSGFGQLLSPPANTFSGSGTVTASGTGPT